MLGRCLVEAMLVPSCHAVEAARVRPVELGELRLPLLRERLHAATTGCSSPTWGPLACSPAAGSPMLDLGPGPFYLRDWGEA
jgi:hypothetical protein